MNKNYFCRVHFQCPLHWGVGAY